MPSRFTLANLYNALGENSSAEEILRQGIKFAPRNGELYYSLGLLLAENSKLEAVANALKSAADYTPIEIACFATMDWYSSN